MKIAFLDRDGTIVLDYPDNDWGKITKPEFISGSIEALKILIELGYQIIIVTNQYIIGDGIISVDKYNEFNNVMMQVFRENDVNILDIFYCPHSYGDNCDCCKPKGGMVLNAIEKYPQIDIKESILIGDSIADMKLAETFDMMFYGINVKNIIIDYQKHIVVTSLYQATKLL